MANKMIIKRTSTSGVLPNTTNSANTSYIEAGELAINLTDKKMVSSNGTTTFEIGANLSSLQISGPVTANGGVGTAGHVLKSGGAGANVYWDAATGSGSPGGSNTYVQFNDSSAFGGVAGFTFNKTTETVTASNLTITNTATINTNSMTVGNSTVNTIVTNTYVRVSNSTTYANLTSVSLNIGANLVANTTEVTAGNTTQHSSMTHTYVHVINSTSTANLSATTLTLGNSTVNTIMSPSLLDIGGQLNANGSVGTAGQILTSGAAGNVYWSSPAGGVAGSNSQIQFNANGVLAGDDGLTYNGVSNTLTVQNITVSGTATLNIDSISVGNSTVNSAIIPTSISIANSTGNSVIVPGGITINSISVGYRDIPQNLQNTAYTFALTDAGKSVGKANASAYTYTIANNTTVAFPVGTAITVFNANTTGNITISITTDTMYLGGTTTTGSRTLAPWGVCTILKVASTIWIASGSGLT